MPSPERPLPSRQEVVRTLSEQLDLLGLGILIIQRGGAIADADAAAQRLLGRDADQLRAIPDVSMLVAPEERFKRTMYRERRLRGVTGGEAFRTIVLRPDGGRRPVEAAVIPVDDGAYTVIVMRDLTDEAVLDQVIDWYASLVERMPVGVVIMDANDVTDPRDIRLWSANPAASAAAGRDLPAFAGRPLSDVFPWAKRFDEARRALALSGTGRVDHFPEFVVGQPDAPTAVYRRTVVGLPEGGIALVLDDITRERNDELQNRRLAERLVSLGDAERRAIAMGIHDDPIQQIAAASLLVAQLRRRGDGEHRAAWLEEVDHALRRATTSLRDLVFELVPPELVESGLASAVATSVDHLFGQSATAVEIDIDLDAEPPQTVQTTAFRIIAEALTNARKHASPTSISVRARSDRRNITVEVTDDGRGIAGAGDRPGHLGLRSMHDRAAGVGGSVEVTSSSVGTTVRAVLPVDAASAARSAADAPPPNLPRTDTDSGTESLRLEVESLRESHTRASVDAGDARDRLAAIAELREVLDALPLDIETRARGAVEHIARAVRDACAIRLVSDDGTMLRRVACWHPDPEQLEFLETWVLADRSAATSHPALIHATQQPLLLDQTRFDWWLPSDGPKPPPAPVDPHHAIGVPLRRGGRSIGVMTVLRDTSPDPLTSVDIPWVWALADVVAVSLPLTPSV